MQKTLTCLWMEDWIEDAVNFYVSLLPNSRVTDASRYPESMGSMAGKPLVMNFELAGTRYMAINGGNQPFPFSEAVSIFVNCDDQAEVDRLWTTLTANGGSEGMCGWLKDKYGLSWQIIPKDFSKYVTGPDKAGANRAMQAMMKMKKLDLNALAGAYAG